MSADGHRARLRGVLIGTAVGDALGLPAEGLSRGRVERWFGDRWEHRLLFGHGMVSDDTDHTVFVAQSLLAHPDSAKRFAGRLGWALRGWLLSLPAGIGFATFRAILRLWIGFPSSKSGVRSAGNGPAMRAAPIGVFFANDPITRIRYTRAATTITHTDPRAFTGANAVAAIAALATGADREVHPALDDVVSVLRAAGDVRDAEWPGLVDRFRDAAARQIGVDAFADELGLEHGVTGYVHHTVPVAVYAWYRHYGDFESTLVAILSCGGDTDTTGAIAGALAGAVVGDHHIPAKWVRGIIDWPRGVGLLRAIAARMAAAKEDRTSSRPVRYFVPGCLVRNLVFLAVVLLHGLRRMAPPY
ncbi:MAG TPA: ADP-ribosylglycohydrolase family protein [Gemmatimonadales bacterium]